MAGYIDAMRSTLAELLGERDTATPGLFDGLPAAARPVVDDAIAELIIYQGPGYAQLYLDRLRRFVGRRGVDEELLIEIARLMLMRMCFEDPIRIAQLTLAEAGVPKKGRAARPLDRTCRFRLDELVSALPTMAADPLLSAIGYVGWLHAPVRMRFNATSFLGICRLRVESWLRRWRLLSVRYPQERAWVERWLHMIDRSLTKQPRAVGQIVQSATLVQGYGALYRQGLADWHLIIDQLAKPTFDGTLPLTDLAGAIVDARAASRPDPQQSALKARIAEIRALAFEQAPPGVAAGRPG
ncbi:MULTISPECIES: DUF6537 domain-containing protein [Rhodopseudomonas]|uniref:DUF6537 domain-containing protein n=1 Tax=Rhodopseudomonas palustris TaxID=1076 RepID=A0A0D7EXW3_RHOPL|nr:MULTISPECIES: DUF6537 domain-containing protein [Rhodopseudomonas]KIZ44267.1 hypothetical protein OO17_10095 [Rhodopseudomonas palustris]MDF3812198.1 hypothetical protein [Rhodopseudomonas sp. BAL398]WOK18095.1 hypothetical protein RBJ75_00790 [Rhodopseudomonas sp. BAL398]